ncbi:MAG TPA: hypothetical protein VFC00_07670 [Micromonosporaceae bacterium]|nr:hypothetical protein [Micromonosporaceae bacterium]
MPRSVTTAGQVDAPPARIGIATSVRATDLSRAEIYPTTGADAVLTLTTQQRQLLSLFG